MITSVQDVSDVANHMLWVTFLLSMPILMTALVVGVLISLVQTITGVQEMTITFVPKLAAVFVAMAVALPWMNSLMMEFTKDMLVLMSGQ